MFADQALASLRIETDVKINTNEEDMIRLSRACGLKLMCGVDEKESIVIRLSRACGLKHLWDLSVDIPMGIRLSRACGLKQTGEPQTMHSWRSGSREPAD